MPNPALAAARSDFAPQAGVAIGAASNLVEPGLQVDGSLEAPPAAFPAGWSTRPAPGATGPAVMAGHAVVFAISSRPDRRPPHQEFP